MALTGREQGVLAAGIGVGAALIAAAPHIGAVLGPAIRPLTKAALKRGLHLYQRGRELGAQWTEDLEDVIAEVRAEIKPADESVEPSATEASDADPA